MSASKVIADLEAGPPTLNVPQVARILGVSKSGLYEAIRRGDAPVKTLRVLGRIKVYEMHRTGTFPVPVLKVGGRYKVRRVDLLSFLGLAGE